MCTGRSPFRASTTFGVLKRVCDDTHRPVQEVNPDVPNWLSQIIDRLLAKDCADRYQTAEEVVDVLGGHLARRQRGMAESLDYSPRPAQQSVATVDDVGPTKGHKRRRRWLVVVGTWVVVLAGLFVIAEATGATRIMDSIAEAVGIRKPKGLIVIHSSSPDLLIMVNDMLLPPGVVTHLRSNRAGGYTVAVFNENRMIAHEFFNLKPGMMVELEVLKNGGIVYRNNGPIHPVLPSRPLKQRVKPPVDTRQLGPDGRPIGTAGRWWPDRESDEHQLLVNRIAQGIRSDTEAMSMLEKIKALTDEVVFIKSVARQSADPALVAAQKRLEKLNQEYNERVQAISEDTRLRMQGRQNLPDSDTP